MGLRKEFFKGKKVWVSQSWKNTVGFARDPFLRCPFFVIFKGKSVNIVRRMG